MIMESTIDLPDPAELDVSSAPHLRARGGILPATWTWLTVATVLAASGLVLFGLQSVQVLAVSVAVALLTESLFSFLARRSRSWSETHALLIGALLACTLPPNVPWIVPATGAAIAVLAAQALLGGLGNYVWHPVALGRVAVQLLFHDALTPSRWPVLAPGHLFWGDLAPSTPLPDLWTWGSAPPAGVESWSLLRTADALVAPLPMAKNGPAESLAHLVRDVLPPWSDTLTGVAGGAIGEACAIAVIAAGLVLMWRGILRWQLVAGALLAAAFAAAALPTSLGGGQDGTSLWFPGLVVWQYLPVGLAYVCYQLTAGGLLLVVLVLACDTTSSPLTSRGHAVFGPVIGAGTVALQTVVGLPAAPYWALLAANTLVPIINRCTRCRVLGT